MTRRITHYDGSGRTKADGHREPIGENSRATEGNYINEGEREYKCPAHMRDGGSLDTVGRFRVITRLHKTQIDSSKKIKYR